MNRYPFLLGLLVLTVSTYAQDATVELSAKTDASEKKIETPDRVEVEPVAEDEDISSRLARIYEATRWFDDIDVSTDEGVVFIAGTTDTDKHREWAEEVAQKTSDVVAVVNRIKVRTGSIWNIQPAIDQLQELARAFIQLLPLLTVGVLILMTSYVIARLAAGTSRKLASRRLDSQLLQQVAASVVAVLVMLVGLYVALKVSGLSRLAVTVLGGTGLIGLALGFAFRDIAENYLASILISLNRPFSVGDLIELEGNKGFVRRVTTRGTLLLTVDGNHIQIPNSTVYKSIVTNFSSSPRIRDNFEIGIGYDDSVSQAQRIIYDTLSHHDSVLDDPEPLVLVDSLGAATVNLKILFWLDGERFDAASVSSALMRQTKAALTEARISMPDEAREVVFPNGVPVNMSEQKVFESKSPAIEVDMRQTEDKVDATSGEGSLANADDRIQKHAEPDEGREIGNNLI